ncbi:MAG: PEP-CTERM sorting domain-containing protein [Armatimonadetes bacterium]|nr:PEP-CTERM sorting domain-containing protein [Armatimonadota bacterium]
MKLKTLAFSMLLGATALASADVLTVGLTISGDMPSMDGYGDSDNMVFGIDMNAVFSGYGNYQNFVLTGLGWDVTLTATAPSWLSELAAAFESSSQADGVYLRPGAGNNFGGTGSYSSGGIVDLVGPGLTVVLDADNILRLEFYESFNDFADAQDGFWHDGSRLDLQFNADLVPEPASMAVLGLGALALIRRRK